MLPPATAELYQAQQRRSLATLALVHREWAGMSDDFDSSWARIGPRVTTLTAASMVGAAVDGAASVPAALQQTGFDVAAEAQVNPAAFGAAASDGRPLDSLLYGAVVTARQAQATSLAQRLAVGLSWLDMVVHTQIADAARGGSSVAITARPMVGWVRMVNPPCCQRCAVLAGKYFKWNQGFRRHPRCDCQHRPAHENERPAGYTETVTPAQIKDLTKGQQAAIADGGNVNQVINSHRGNSGMTTSEGTTRRGVYGGYRRSPDGSLTRVQRGEKVPPRLTPEAVYRVSASREEAVSLLKRYGYLT